MKVKVTEIQKKVLIERLILEANNSENTNPHEIAHKAISHDLIYYLKSIQDGDVLIGIFGDFKKDDETCEYSWDKSTLNVLFFKVIASDKLLTTELKKLVGPGPMGGA